MSKSPASDDAQLLGQALSLRTLVDHVGAYFYAKDAAGRYTFANEAVCRLFRAPLADVIGASDERFFDMAGSLQLATNDRRVLDEGIELHAEEEVTLQGGEQRVFWSIKVPIRDAAQRVQGLCGISIDMTRRRRAADDLIERNQLLSTLLANVDAFIYLKDHEGRYVYANRKVLELYGRPAAEVIGRSDAELLPADTAARLAQLDTLVLSSGARQAREELIVGADGREHHFWSIKLPLKLPGQPANLIGFSSEITELLELRQDLERQRTVDGLTGLPNRQQFEVELAAALEAAERRRQPLAVLLVDLDQFKHINSSLGQAAGDELLLAAAERLRAGGVPVGHLARLSGDEFACTVAHAPATDAAAAMAATAACAEQLRALLAAPFQLDGRALHLTASVGVSLFPADGRHGPELIGHAETAMYLAKEQGRNQYRFYSAALGAAAAERHEMERGLRAALAAGEFVLHYQPKIRCRDGGIAGVEALIRWHREGHGLVPPARFIPLAEQLGLVVQLGEWVIEEACRQMARWSALGLGEVPVAVNLSPAQLASPALPGRVAALLANHGIGEGRLEMEVTESMMMDDPEQAIALLHALRGLGVRLSIDDFGTGFSSMAYLKRLPVDTLKLDRHFVSQVDTDPRDGDLCAGVIALAHKLGLQVVAEGVETDAQRAALAERDCDLFQGYLFSRPLPAEAATAYLAARLQAG